MLFLIYGSISFFHLCILLQMLTGAQAYADTTNKVANNAVVKLITVPTNHSYIIGKYAP